eukprot:1153203-Pelagomonas_calceolata.AAC.8
MVCLADAQTCMCTHVEVCMDVWMRMCKLVEPAGHTKLHVRECRGVIGGGGGGDDDDDDDATASEGSSGSRVAAAYTQAIEHVCRGAHRRNDMIVRTREETRLGWHTLCERPRKAKGGFDAHGHAQAVNGP